MTEDKKVGFKVGNYFISFPEDEFIKEDENGSMYVLVDIFKLDEAGNAFKLEQEEITPEIESMVNTEVSKMLTAAMDEMKSRDK